MPAGCYSMPSLAALEWLVLLREAWQEAAVAASFDVALPPEDWLRAHHLPLLAALILVSTLDHATDP